ncbi:Flagellar basal body-associated protein FliL [Gemmobacter megaterium]|uniref:Flagellar protein FliL n=1 Tax=Gemmobacter megaterium TaxID=1086013 RepID=A0A1N7LWE4_9RHOB|nr:flagellar basal body-associated FliL family protein [Gemmobacter megaterium]GGE10288.1 flagellar basal body-associated protein FliL [Gemmobacter megaterium]SIS78124.1 Flagellar basal body-associated protein FliL [Gemmobacter megaterium]
MRKLLPLVVLIVGAIAGGAAGLVLRPTTEPEIPPEEAGPDTTASDARDYVKLPNQFVVPVLEGGRVGSLVVLALSLEVPVGGSDAIFTREPKLRDEFLRVLFDHANAGGFRGTFTDGGNLVALRRALLEAARKVTGAAAVSDVLITDILRQDG